MPLVSQSGEGHTSEPPICKERAQALRAAVARAPTPRYLGAAATLSTEDTAATRAKRGFRPRLPGPLTRVSQGMPQALQGDRWPRLDETTRADGLALWHYGMAHRWLGVSAHAAMERAEARRTTAQPRAWEALAKPLGHGSAPRCETPEAAQAALQALAPAWRAHPRAASQGSAHKHYAGPGRPPPSPRKAMAWQRDAQVRPAQAVMEAHKPQRACGVMGTTMPAGHRREAEVRRASQAHAGVEGGGRWLKAPVVFVASLCVKNPSRLPGVLTVMTLALLGYALTQRRWRQPGAAHKATRPKQIPQPTERPTLRGGFQLLAGMHRGRVMVQGQVHDVIEGLNDVQIKILRLLGDEVCRLYQISSG